MKRPLENHFYENAPLKKKPFGFLIPTPSLSHLPQPQQQTLLTPAAPSTSAVSSNCSSISSSKRLHHASKRPREILLPTQTNSTDEDLQPHNVKYPRTLPDIRDEEIRPTPVSSPIELSPDSLITECVVSTNGKEDDRTKNMQVILHPSAATSDGADTAINHHKSSVALLSLLRRSPLLHEPSNSSLFHWPASATPLLQEIYESLQQTSLQTSLQPNRPTDTDENLKEEEGEGDSMPVDTPPLQQASSPLTRPQGCTDIEVEDKSVKIRDVNCGEEECSEAYNLPSVQAEEEMMLE